MAKRIYFEDNYLVIAEALDPTDDIRNLSSNVYVEKNGELFIFYRLSDNHLIESIRFDDILDVDGVAYETLELFTDIMEKKTGKPNSLDVFIQSSTSPLVIVKATELVAQTTIAIQAVEDAKTLTVTSIVGAAVGEQLTVYSPIENRLSFFNIIDIVGNVITVDSPIDFAYDIGSFAQFGSANMAVDGSVTPRIFGIRNPTAQDIELSVDFTRIILSMQLTTAGDYDEFGNIPRLTNGLVCRFVNGRKQNIFNIKDNREFDNLMFDFKFIPASGNAPDGLSGRFTFEKLGSVVRLKPFEDLQFIVQDDLRALTTFEILTQGAGVTE